MAFKNIKFRKKQRYNGSKNRGYDKVPNDLDNARAIKPSKIFNVYESGRALYTMNLTPGKKFFHEPLVRYGNKEYREWDSRRSKLAAAIIKGARNVFIREGNSVLYLGAAHGYTVSFISDLVGASGFIFAIDSAPRVVRDLIFLAEQRQNIAPILADANHPEGYNDKVLPVDILYQDIAQRNQVEIFLNNVNIFLKPGGYGLLALKARSIDITRKPQNIFNEARDYIDKRLPVVDFRLLDPFEKDHCFIIVKNKKANK